MGFLIWHEAKKSIACTGMSSMNTPRCIRQNANAASVKNPGAAAFYVCTFCVFATGELNFGLLCAMSHGFMHSK